MEDSLEDLLLISATGISSAAATYYLCKSKFEAGRREASNASIEDLPSSEREVRDYWEHFRAEEGDDPILGLGDVNVKSGTADEKTSQTKEYSINKIIKGLAKDRSDFFYQVGKTYELKRREDELDSYWRNINRLI